MRKWVRLLPAALLVAGITVGCNSSNPSDSDGDNGGGVSEDPAFAAEIQPIFSGNCASAACHGTAEQAGLKLSQGSAYAELVNVTSTQDGSKQRVLPNDSANSYIVMKLEGTGQGARMPSGAAALPDNTIQLIKNWIDQGAQDN